MAQLAKVVPLFGRETSTEPRLTKREVAQVFGVSGRTIERWMARGLPHEKPFVNGSVRFVASRVEGWLAAQQQGRS